MTENTPHESVDRRRFLSNSMIGCGCLTVAALEQSIIPQEATAQERRGRGAANPLLTEPAFCGLFCGACGGLQDTVKTGKPDGCLGCKSNKLGGHCRVCKVRECALSRRVVNCGVCLEYPCNKIKEYHNDEKEMTYMAIARKNSEDFMYFGDDPDWSEKQLKRWSCPKCNTPFHFKSGVCPKCQGAIATVEVEAEVYARRKTPSFIEFDGRSWQNNLAYKTETSTKAGRKIMHVVGNERTMVFLPDAGFRDGTIECDLAVKSSGGIAFRTAEDGSDAELVQFRLVNTKKDRNKKLLLYSCHKNWRTGWRELRAKDPGKYDADVKLAKDKWFRLKLVVEGRRLDVFLDKAEEPVLTIEKMLGKREEGGIGLYGEDAQFANIAIS